MISSNVEFFLAKHRIIKFLLWIMSGEKGHRKTQSRIFSWKNVWKLTRSATFNRFSYLRKPKRSDSDGRNRSLVSEQHTIRFYGPSLIVETSRASRTEWIDIIQPTDVKFTAKPEIPKQISFVYKRKKGKKEWNGGGSGKNGSVSIQNGRRIYKHSTS